MGAFKFKLQRVLDVRYLEEEQKRIKFYQEKQKAQKLKEQLAILNQKKEGIYQYLRSQELSVEDNLRGRKYLRLHINRINRLKEKINDQQKIVKRVQKEFIDKKKEKEIMEKLKEKEQEKFYKEFYHKQQKELDEIGLHFTENQGL